jgi:polyferredoxin
MESSLTSFRELIINTLDSCNKIILFILQKKSLRERKYLRDLVKINLIIVIAFLSGYIILIFVFMVRYSIAVLLIGGDDGPRTVYIAISTKKL